MVHALGVEIQGLKGRLEKLVEGIHFFVVVWSFCLLNFFLVYLFCEYFNIKIGNLYVLYILYIYPIMLGISREEKGGEGVYFICLYMCFVYVREAKVYLVVLMIW